ncbi:MAG: GerMN domain-containing protein [Patescibacteria group bacterium]
MKKPLFLVIILSLFLLSACSLKNPLPKKEGNEINGPVACTMEAKICPDGSAVGRSGPNCEFAPCPSEATTSPNELKPSVSLYFGNSNFNPNAADCAAVYPREHLIAGTDSNPNLALQELFKGPSADDKAQGYYSWFSEATVDILNNVVVENGTAKVDLKDIRLLIPNASTSCGSAQLLAEMTTTLKQFSDIKTVVFSINGDAATFYEWLQLAAPSE